MVHPIQRFGAAFILGMGAAFSLLPSGSASAAEKVTLKYGPFARSVSVESLQSFASTGEASGDLASLLKVVKSEQRESMAGLLNTKLPFGVVQVDKLIRSPLGEQFLTEVATATILPGDDDESEVKALRSAAILAAAQDKSLNFGTMLEKYPTKTLTVDLPVLIKILRTNPTVGSLLGGSAAPDSGDVTPDSGDASEDSTAPSQAP